jgi:hypothetical protein
MLRGFLIAICLTLGTAWATASERWQAPDGAFSLALAENGWRQVERSDHPDWFNQDLNILLLTTPVGDDRPDSICSVVLNDSRSTSASQDSINDGLRGPGAAFIVDHFRNNPRYRVELVETIEVDGVETLTIQGGFGRLATVQRHFFLVRGAELRKYTLTCSVPQGDDAAHAAMLAVAGSLRFGSPI